MSKAAPQKTDTGYQVVLKKPLQLAVISAVALIFFEWLFVPSNLPLSRDLDRR